MELEESFNNCRSFYAMDEGVGFHVIKTGFPDVYLVVQEDAFDETTGNVFRGSKKEVEDKFKIVL